MDNYAEYADNPGNNKDKYGFYKITLGNICPRIGAGNDTRDPCKSRYQEKGDGFNLCKGTEIC